MEDGPLRKGRARFADLLAVSLPRQDDKTLRDALKHLNDARNAAAHRNDDTKFEDSVGWFVEAARRLEGGGRDVASNDPLEVVKQAGAHVVYAIYTKASELWKL